MGIFNKTNKIKLYHLYTDANKHGLVIPVRVSESVPKKKILDKDHNLLMKNFANVHTLNTPGCNTVRLFINDEGKVHHVKPDFANNLVICLVVSDITQLHNFDCVSDVYTAIPATDFVNGEFEEVIRFTETTNVPIVDSDFEILGS